VKITSDITRGFNSWKKSSGWAVETLTVAGSVMGLSTLEGRPLLKERPPIFRGPDSPD
jgi:hypothetical protein